MPNNVDLDKFIEKCNIILDSYRAVANISLVDPDVYDPKPAGIKRYDIILYDVFPTEVKLSDSIEASSSNPITIGVTFNYNYFLVGDENN